MYQSLVTQVIESFMRSSRFQKSKVEVPVTSVPDRDGLKLDRGGLKGTRWKKETRVETQVEKKTGEKAEKPLGTSRPRVERAKTGLLDRLARNER